MPPAFLTLVLRGCKKPSVPIVYSYLQKRAFEPMKHLLRKTLIAVAIIALGAFLVNYFMTVAIPKAFLESRIQTAGSANNLAVLTNNSLANLKQIETFESNNSTEQALDMISFEVGKKQEKQNAAVLLASHLDNMAKETSGIISNRARGLALEAITSGVSMVSRMISYNNSLDQLFSAIQLKITSGNPPVGTNIRGIISSLNGDAKSINELNTKFNDALKEFDSRYGQK